MKLPRPWVLSGLMGAASAGGRRRWDGSRVLVDATTTTSTAPSSLYSSTSTSTTVTAVASASASTAILSGSSSATATFTTSAGASVDDEERLEEDDGDEGGDDEERQEEEGDDEGGGEGEDEDDDDDEDDDERDDDDGDRSGYDDSVDDDSEGDGEEVKEDDDNEYGDDDEEYGDDDAEYGDDDTEDNSNSVEEGNDDEEGDDDDELDDDEKEDSDEEQSDAGQEDDDQEQEEPGASDGSFSSIQVLTPSEGQVLMPESSYEVTWAVDSEEGSSPDLFHVDLYNCGDDQACGSGSGDGGCLGGDLVQPLCPEEGCYSDGGGGTSVTLPKVDDDLGRYFKIAVSPDDGTYDPGCSGSFTMEAAAEEEETHESTSEGDDDVEESLDDDEVEPEPEPEDEGDWCDTLGTIPYPLEGNLTVALPTDVAQVSCPSPLTVRVAGGTLTVAVDSEEVVFSGVRFEVESAASLIFSTNASTEFTGIDNLQGDGGVLNVSEDGTVEMNGLALFRNNSVQATTPDSPSSGGSIYNKGIVRLRGGATFADNFVHGYYYDEEDEEEEEAEQGTGGDGGALWNGGRILFDAGARLEGNGVVGRGNGGGLWNEGFVKFGQEATFTLNVVEGGGGGGGVFNQGGLVRFEETTTFSENEAFDGSAFVNSAGGRVVVRQETSIIDNVSQEDDDSVAGAVWNQVDSVLFCTATVSWEGNSGYQAGAMLNAGRVVFRGEVSVRDNTAIMDGGGFINESEGRILFFDGAEFLSNVGTGSGGAILNHGELDFTAGGDDSSSSADDGSSEESTTLTFTLDFQDNYCGEQECQDIQNKHGSSILGLHKYVHNLCDIGTQDIVAT